MDPHYNSTLKFFAPSLWHANARRPLVYFHTRGSWPVSRTASCWLQRKIIEKKCFVGKLQQGKWIINMLHERTVAGSCVWVWGAHETQGETAMHPKDAGPPASASAAAAPSRGRRRLKLPQAGLGCYRSNYLMAKTPQDLSALLKSG